MLWWGTSSERTAVRMDLKTTVQKLRDFDPAVRKAAIIELANSKDTRVLKPLKWVYENDDDPELRKLALRAAKYIRQKADEDAAAEPQIIDDTPPPNSYTFAFDDDNAASAYAQQSAPRQRAVSDGDKKAARGHMERAMDLKIRGQTNKARELVVLAFERDPGLKDDMMAVGLASDLFDMPTQDVVKMLLNATERDSLKHQARAEIRKVESAETTEEFYNAMFWLILYFLATFVPVVLGWFFLDSIFQEAANDPTLTPDQRELLDALRSIAVVTVVLVAVGLGAFQTFYQMIYAYSVHLVARFIFIGRGSYLGILVKLTQISLIYVAVSLGTFGVSFVDPAIGTVLSCMSIPLLLVILYYLIQIISKHYDIGAVSGCMTIVISTILLAIGQFMFFFVLLAALGAA